MITHFRGLTADFPDDKELKGALDTVRRKLLERNAEDAARARAAVIPVKHTIQITAK